MSAPAPGFLWRPFGLHVTFANGLTVSLSYDPTQQVTFPRTREREGWSNPFGLNEADAANEGRAAEIARARVRPDHGELPTPDVSLVILVTDGAGKRLHVPVATPDSEWGGYASPDLVARVLEGARAVPEGLDPAELMARAWVVANGLATYRGP